jgi:hypothetical protein
MDEDDVVMAVAEVLMLAHIAALAWAWWKHQIAGVVILNLLISAGVALYWLTRIAGLWGSAIGMQAFVAFELAVLTTSLLAIFRVRVPRALIWTEFGVHTALVAGALYFMLTFKMTRMF